MATKPRGSGGEVPDADDSDATGRDLAAARKGCTEALGKLLDECRQYLLLVANEEIADALRPKVAPSDLVQDSFLEAQRDFHRFRGTTRAELLAWLRQILLHNLANARRAYLGTAKRQASREIAAGNLWLSRLAGIVPGDNTPLVTRAARKEDFERLECLMAQLPDDYRTVLRLRHLEQLSFRQIGTTMSRSADAARMLWYRAVERLGELAESEHGDQ